MTPSSRRRLSRLGLLAALLAGAALVAAVAGGLTAADGERGATAGVVSDADAYLGIDFEDGCPVVLALSNRHYEAFEDVTVAVDGGAVDAAPARLAVGETATAAIPPDGAAPATLVVTVTAVAADGAVEVRAERTFVAEVGCGVGTETIGYWKTHPDAWPVEELTVGGRTLTKAEALSYLDAPGGPDRTVSLLVQSVATKLNLAAGTDDACIAATVADADAWLAANPVGSGVTGGDAAWATGEPLKDELDAYNNGLRCAPKGE